MLLFILYYSVNLSDYSSHVEVNYARRKTFIRVDWQKYASAIFIMHKLITFKLCKMTIFQWLEGANKGNRENIDFTY